jgi:alpha-L-fucosidase
MALVRELQPGIIVNDRLEIGGDLKTPEQYQPREWVKVDGQPVVWEACQTLNGSWGYDRDNLDWKPVSMLVQMLVDSVSKGGNLLLNVGPTARGEFDPRAQETLRGLGAWTRLHRRSIEGATASDFTPPPDCRFTQRGDRLYLHLFSWPFRHVHLDGLADRVAYAQLLHDASEVRRIVTDPRQPAQNTDMAGTPGTLTLELPVQRPDVLVPVVELCLKDRPPSPLGRDLRLPAPGARSATIPPRLPQRERGPGGEGRRGRGGRGVRVVRGRSAVIAPRSSLLLEGA